MIELQANGKQAAHVSGESCTSLSIHPDRCDPRWFQHNIVEAAVAAAVPPPIHAHIMDDMCVLINPTCPCSSCFCHTIVDHISNRERDGKERRKNPSSADWMEET